MITKQYFGFWCNFCNSVHYVEDVDYKKTDDFYEYRLICPGCRKSIIIKERTPLSYIKEYKKYKQ